MKTKTIFSILLILVLIPAFRVSAQKDNFSGDWKLNKEKSALSDAQLFLSKITIQLKSDTLFTTRTYENSNGEEYPFDEKLSLDGKDCKIVVFNMPRTSKATLSDADKSIKINSATTFSGNNGEEDMLADETWTVENDGQFLTLSFTNKMSGNDMTGKYYFERVK